VRGLCRPVVYQPKVGVDGAWPCCYSVAVACVHCELFVGVDVSTVMDGDLDVLGRQISSGRARRESSTYVATHVDVEHLLDVRPYHAVRCIVRAHARRLPCEDNGAIGGWRGEVGPSHRRGVARDLRPFDEVLERLSGLQGWEGWKAVGRDQMDVLKLSGLAGSTSSWQLNCILGQPVMQRTI